MLVGVTLINSSSSYYCPGFARAGETLSLTVEVMNLEGSATLDIDVQHKNSGDTTWTSAGTFTQIGSTGISTEDVTGLKEQIRLKYDVGGTANSDFVHFYVFAPTWK